MYNAEKTKSRFNYAGSSLAAGIIGFFIPFIGFLFGIAGFLLAKRTIKTIQKTGEKGYYVAMAGLICSIAVIVATILEFIGVWIFYIN